MNYNDFLDSERQLANRHGFEPLWMPSIAFDFQKYLMDWNIRQGRSADFADTGLGKSIIELTYAENVVGEAVLDFEA